VARYQLSLELLAIDSPS